MLMIGTDITSRDSLERTKWSGIYDMVKKGTHQLKSRLDHLRTIKTIDEKQYHNAKRDLPFFTSSIFHPPYRKKEHFASASGMIIDLDKIGTQKQKLNSLREKIRARDSTVLEFVSPSGEGLKIGIKFEEPIYDAALYSEVYKKYVWNWANELDVLDYVDFSTSDATRATFLSFDPSAYFNPGAQPVEISDFIDSPMPDQFEESLKNGEDDPRQKPTEEKRGNASKAIHAIKKRLNTSERSGKKQKPDVYVPPEVDDSIELIKEELAGFDIQLIETEPIQYGRKLKAGIPDAWTEVNVFYGKKGFSIVITPKKGSNTELGEVVKKIINPVLKD